jgi:hypothetical protein
MSIDIKDVTKADFLWAFLASLFLLLPGIITLFIFERELFITLDWIKLVLLGTAITLPLSLLNILLSLIEESRSNENVEFFGHFILGTIIGGVSLYVTLAIHQIRSMSFSELILYATLADLIVFGWVILRASKKS